MTQRVLTIRDLCQDHVGCDVAWARQILHRTSLPFDLEKVTPGSKLKLSLQEAQYLYRFLVVCKLFGREHAVEFFPQYKDRVRFKIHGRGHMAMVYFDPGYLAVAMFYQSESMAA